MLSELTRKNLSLAVLIVAGTVGLVYYLWPGPRVPVPNSYRVNWYQTDEVQQTIANVDQEFRAAWTLKKLQAAGEVDSLRLARRISLGLMGTLPSLEELRAFENQPEQERINWWVSRLLDDRRTSDYLAERLARAYVGVEDGPFIIFRRRRFVTWLSDQIQDGTRYDQIVQTLLTDNGLWTDSPAVNFVTVTSDDDTGRLDPVRLAGRTTRAFLGMRIDCLQCHDDFLGDIELGDADDLEGGAQTHFHELAAFFAQVQNSIGGVRDAVHSEPYRYMFLGETEETPVEPAVPYRDDLLPVDENRRAQLAAWVTSKENRPFARAIVNRIWAIVCGQPLVKPVDHIPLHGPFPPGMEPLVDDFVAHNFDLKRLVRIIVATQAFRQDSAADFDVTHHHQRYWAVFPSTRLRPEQVAGAMIQSTSLATIDSSSHVFARIARYGQEQEFVDRYGDWGEEEFVPRGATVTQRLLMMNGEMVQALLDQPLGAPNQIAQLSPDADRLVETAFLATLTRLPLPAEKKYFCQRIENASGDELSEIVQDMYWALINRSEFSWNY